MADFTRYLLLGLGSGGVYALVALGIVLVYRGSGVVNFAHGALALTGAGVFYEARPHTGLTLALILGIASGAVAGLAINLLVMTPMRRSSPLARVIATLGALSLGTELWKHVIGGSAQTIVQQFLPNRAVAPLGHGILVGENLMLIFCITVGLGIILWGIYRYTRFGVATTAVAENEVVAAAQGWSPVTIASLNWAFGGALAAFGGIMLATLSGLSTDSQVLVVVPALAAALIGRFSSFTLTIVGGLLIGVLESEALNFGSPAGYLAGMETGVPFVVIILILIVRGRSIPLRSHLADRLQSLGTGRVRPVPVVVATAVAIISLWAFGAGWSGAVITSAAMGFVVLSLLVIVGYAGQLSLAQWTLAGVGALLAGRLAGDLWNLPFPLAVVVGVLLTMLVGVIVALPALRVRGVSLAVTTLALADVLTNVFLSNPAYTGGLIQGTVIPTPSLFGWHVDSVAHPQRYGLVWLVVFALAALVVANLRRGRTGRSLIAVRDNERAAATMGVRVTAMKIYAFAVAAGLAALGGSVVAFRYQNLDFSGFDLLTNVNALLFVAIGGIGWIGGAIMAAVTYTAGMLNYVLSLLFNTTGWYLAVAAALLVITVILNPDGVVAKVSADFSEVERLVRSRVVGPRARRSPAAAAPVASNPVGAAPRPVRVAPKALEVSGLAVTYGTSRVLDGVSFQARPGEVLGIIGPNGAGKTTLIEATTGFVKCKGTVHLSGSDISGHTPQRRSREGLMRSFQSLELLEDLSVIDNIRVACTPGDTRSLIKDLVWPSDPPLSQAALAGIAEFSLDSVLAKRPSELPYAQRRLLAVARAVAASPSVLLLDEPAAGLDNESRQELARLIRRLADDWGMTVLLVEHDVEMVMTVCDRVIALNFGRVIAEGAPAEVRLHEQVIASYLGSKDPMPEVSS
jgi:sulfate-transporting ATPase